MHNIGQADLIKTGIPNDVHCDGGDFQVSILPEELITDYTQIGPNQVKRDGSKCKDNMHKSLIFCKVTVAGIITVGDQVYLE